MARTPQTLKKRLRERALQMKRLAKINKRHERNAAKREAKKAAENAPLAADKPPDAKPPEAAPADPAVPPIPAPAGGTP